MKGNNSSNLKDPNDLSPGQCYAPVDKNGDIIEKERKHTKEGEDPPKNWVMVLCSIGCQGKR